MTHKSRSINLMDVTFFSFFRFFSFYFILFSIRFICVHSVQYLRARSRKIKMVHNFKIQWKMKRHHTTHYTRSEYIYIFWVLTFSELTQTLSAHFIHFTSKIVINLSIFSWDLANIQIPMYVRCVTQMFMRLPHWSYSCSLVILNSIPNTFEC